MGQKETIYDNETMTTDIIQKKAKKSAFLHKSVTAEISCGMLRLSTAQG
jgi:hypothetical protein